MSNYEASGANYSLWELESACSTACRHWLSDFLSFFLGWSHLFFPSVPCREKPSERKASEPGCSPRSNQTASLLPNKAVKILFIIILFYCAKCHRFPWQQPLTYFKKLFYIYMCAACGCHLVYKPERGQAWSGCAAGSPRSTLCSLESTLHRVHQTVIIIFPPWAPAQNPGQAHPGMTLREDFWPALPWHGATALSQIYFLPPCGFPKWQIRGSAMEKLFGIFIHGKTSEQGVSGIDALSETSINRQLQIQRCWDL